MEPNDPSGNGTGISRRQFGGRAVAVASVATYSAAAEAASVGLSAADGAALEAKYNNVIRKYGSRLSPGQRGRVRQTLIQHQKMLARVRDFALENSDPPALGFHLYPTGRTQD